MVKHAKRAIMDYVSVPVIVLIVVGGAQSKRCFQMFYWWVIVLFQVKQNDLTQVNSHVT